MKSPILKYLGLMFAAITTVFMGLELSFNVYAIALKDTFNFTQTGVELIASAGVAGMGASWIESFVTGRFGYKAGYLLIWLVTSGSACLLWLATRYRTIFRGWLAPIGVFQFLLGASQNAASTRLAAISVHNFSRKHTGKLVGVFYAAIAAGKFFYGELLQAAFEGNLEIFFFCVSVISCLSVGICFFFHRPAEEQDRLLDYENRDSSNEYHTRGEAQSAEMANCSLKDIMASVRFHALFWPSVIFYAIVFASMNNVTSVALSLRIEQPMDFVYMLSAIVVSGRTFVGLIYDRFSSLLCGFLLVLGSSLATLLGMVLISVHFSLTTLIVWTVCIGLGISCGLTIPASMLASQFGQRHFAWIIGCFYCMTAVICLILQFVIGELYDKKLSRGEYCYGSRCFHVSFIVLSFLCFLLIISHLLNFLWQYKTVRNDEMLQVHR